METPWVTYSPLVNDVEVKNLTAFDQNGEEFVIDAYKPPSMPTVVIAFDEDPQRFPWLAMGPAKRIDPLSTFERFVNLIIAPAFADTGGGGGGGSGGDGDPYYHFRVKRLKMEHSAWDYEPWWKGDADFSWKMLNPDLGEVYFNAQEGLSHDCWEWDPIHWWRTDYGWKTHNKVTQFNLSDYWPSYFYFDMYETDGPWPWDDADYMGRVQIYTLTSGVQRSGYGGTRDWYSIDYDYVWQ